MNGPTLLLRASIAFLVFGLCLYGQTANPKQNEQRENCDARISKLLQTIDDNPDELHNDITPSARELVNIGAPALPRTIMLLLSENKFTRLHADRVVHGIVIHMFGFREGVGWASPGEEQYYTGLCSALGQLRWEDTAATRRKDVDRWLAWANILVNGKIESRPSSENIP